MFSGLKRMTFSERVLNQKPIQMFKTIRGNAPEYLRTSFTSATDIHAILLRSSSSFQLYTPKPHLKIYRNTFVFSVFFIIVIIIIIIISSSISISSSSSSSRSSIIINLCGIQNQQS